MTLDDWAITRRRLDADRWVLTLDRLDGLGALVIQLDPRERIWSFAGSTITVDDLSTCLCDLSGRHSQF